MQFSLNLKLIRESRSITQQEMANLLSMTRQAYAKYEQGKREPKFEILEKIQIILNCSYDELLK